METKTLKRTKTIEEALRKAHHLATEALAIGIYREGDQDEAMTICRLELEMGYDEAGKWLSKNS